MRPGGRRQGRVIGLLALALAGSAILALGVGAVPIAPADTLRMIAWKLGFLDRPGVPASTEVILLQLRLPRVLLAGAVGMALATSGAVFQGLFRNPLADPAIVGVSSGAALGAIAVIVAGGAGLLGGTAITLAAFAGAVLTALVVYRLARVGPTVHVTTLLLAGVAVAAVVSAAISIVMSFSGEQIRSIYFWLLGGLGARGWEPIAIVTPPIAAAVLGARLVSADLNLVALGEERAAQLGVDLDRFKRRCTALGALLAACAVSVAGVIGFVGLMTPHLLRLIVGADHRRLVPAVALGGPTFLILADLVARTVVAPEELPVGVVTALLGGPFFLWLLRRERRRAAGVA
jgi:iron complex transport system permease protein